MSALIPIYKIMTDEVKTLDPQDTFDQADRLFKENDIHHLPVVGENEEVVGIISKCDLFSLSLPFTIFKEDLGKKINASYFASLRVSEVMSRPVVCLRDDEPISKAISIFRENLFHALPVINEFKRLVGIVTTYDVIIFLDQYLKRQSHFSLS